MNIISCKIRSLLKLLALLFAITISYTYASSTNTKEAPYKWANKSEAKITSAEKTNENPERTELIGGWYNWAPYQYEKVPGNEKTLEGLDVDISKIIFDEFGKSISVPPVSWKQHQLDLKDGTRDFAMGAFYTDARSKYSHYVGPYRNEENSFFVLRENVSKNPYNSAKSFLKGIKESGAVIGVIDGYSYADDDINAYVKDPHNKITFSKTDEDNLILLRARKIDGFLADRIVGANLIYTKKITKDVSEVFLNVKKPIYMLLSQKSINKKSADKIDTITKKLIQTLEFKNKVLNYIYPVVMLQTIDTDWFKLLQVIGTIAFSISGFLMAYLYNTSIIGAVLLAMLPAICGGALRDIILGRFPIWFIDDKFYFIIPIIVVLCGFVFVKINELCVRNKKENKFFKKFLDVLLLCSDALGLAAFMVTGVVVALVARVDPLWLWGPFFAFVTGAGGGILRDLLIKAKDVEAINGGIYGEIAILWGSILSFYLIQTATDINPKQLQFVVISVIIGAFITRMTVYMFNIQNITFRSKNEHVN